MNPLLENKSFLLENDLIEERSHILHCMSFSRSYSVVNESNVIIGDDADLSVNQIVSSRAFNNSFITSLFPTITLNANSNLTGDLIIKFYNPLKQSNDSNPKIRKVSDETFAKYSLVDKIAKYEVRIVKHYSLKPFIKSGEEYIIQFNNDLEQLQRFLCLDVEESYQEGLYWKLILGQLKS